MLFSEMRVSAFENRLQSPKKGKNISKHFYTRLFSKGLCLLLKSEFLMRDRALHISHNAALS